MEAGSAALRVDWPVYPRRAEHNTVTEGGIQDRLKLRVRTRSNRASRGRPEHPPALAELWGARALHPDQPQITSL